MQEDSKWLNDFIRKLMLEKNGTMAEAWVHGTDRRRHFPGAAFICTIWKEEKKEDTFIGYLMQMKYLSESTGVDFRDSGRNRQLKS